jgi:hypothetical protein
MKTNRSNLNLSSSIILKKSKDLNMSVIVKLQHNMKNTSFVAFALFSILLIISSVSALSLSGLPSSIQLSSSNMNSTLQFNSDVHANVSILATPSTIPGLSWSASLSNPHVSPTSVNTIFVKMNPTNSLSFGTYSLSNLNITAVNSTDASENISYQIPVTFVKGFCSNGPDQSENLVIDSVKVTNNIGDKKFTWGLLDEITVEVRVKNNNDSKSISDITVELGLIDDTGSNRVTDLVFTSSDEEKVDIGTLGDGEKDTATFEFKVPSDIKTGTYKLVVKAYSNNENSMCTDVATSLGNQNPSYENINVESQSSRGKYIAFDNLKVTSSELVCGDSQSITATMANIGNRDQDRIRVVLVNRELGVNLSQEYTSGLTEGDSRSIAFSFSIPQGVSEKTYNLQLYADYNYRNGGYTISSDEPVIVPMKVFGCAPVQTERVAAISASSEGQIKAGEKITIKETVTNLQKSTSTFVFNVKGYENWATLDSISQRTAQLAPGESKEITITLLANEDVTGQKILTLEALSNSRSESRDVSISFPATESSSFELGGNWLIWVIGAVNVILILLIIVVAIRVSRR